jgi:signal transduction histidine kinase
LLIISATIFATSLVYLIKYRKNLSCWMLEGMIVGWIFTLVYLLSYLTRHYYYASQGRSIYLISETIWRLLINAQRNVDLSIRCLTMGYGLFIYSYLGYTICYVIAIDKSKRIYSLLIILFLIQIIFGDPYIFKSMYAGTMNIFSSESLIQFFRVADKSFKILSITLVGIATFLLFYYLTIRPKIRFLQKYTYFVISTSLIIALFYFWILFLVPKIQIQPTKITNYFLYNIPFPEKNMYIYSLLPYLISGFLILTIYIHFNYTPIEEYKNNRNLTLREHISTIHLGIKPFTHSLKNHLITIQAETEFLKKGGIRVDKQNETLSVIESTCTDAIDIINLASEKLKEIDLLLKLTDFNKPVQEAVKRVHDLDHNVHTIIENYNEGLMTVFIDPKPFTEAVYNILVNAKEAIRSVDNGVIRVQTDIRPPWIVVSIQDNGPGMSEDIQLQIFNQNFSTKSSLKNWGFGLPFAYKIVEAHGGRIKVDSIEGKGSNFQIFLPTV